MILITMCILSIGILLFYHSKFSYFSIKKSVSIQMHEVKFEVLLNADSHIDAYSKMELEMNSVIEVNIFYLPSDHYLSSLTDDDIDEHIWFPNNIVFPFISSWLC